MKNSKSILQIGIAFFAGFVFLIAMQSFGDKDHYSKLADKTTSDKPEYFQLRPEVEKAYGYSHAVKIGNHIKVSGAVSMDNAGNPTAVGDIEQQMKNCYSDLQKVLEHYGASFDDVVVENIFTTDMATLLQKSAYRSSIYTNHFPTGTWVEVKGLALPPFMVEIEIEAYISQ